MKPQLAEIESKLQVEVIFIWEYWLKKWEEKGLNSLLLHPKLLLKLILSIQREF